MSKSIYALKYADGSTKILCKPWAEAKLEVQGVKGLIFKGFDNTKDAEKWLTNQKISHTDNKSDILKLYVDGSFDAKQGLSGWGFVAVKNDEAIHSACGATALFSESRNIAGECFASIMALKWLNNKEPAELIHDYAGLGAWLTGDWKPKSRIALFYVGQCSSLIDKITFIKVKGHSNNKWNDIADELAWKGTQNDN